jgi:hypothetical protein
MKTTFSLIASFGILAGGICGVSSADQYHSVIENQTITYVDNCNNLVTITKPVEGYCLHDNNFSYGVFDRPYSRSVYYPYSETWHSANSKPRGLFGYRHRGWSFRRF